MKDSAERKKLLFEATANRIRNYHTAYSVMLCLISCFEICMTVRGFIFWDLSKPHYLAYIIAYIVLLTASLVTFGALTYNKKHGTIDKLVNSLVNVYGSIIILWSGVISLIDVTRGHTMIVFLTIIMVEAAVLIINPIIYTSIVTPLTVILVVQAFASSSELTTSSGYLINFSVFVLFAIVLSFTQYNQMIRTFTAKKQLEFSSFHDQLTGVYNRRSLQIRIAEMQRNTIFYFGIIDVDFFKSVNDTYGHDVGDDCLKTIAKLLCEKFGDGIYRYGGDEFVIVTNQRESDLTKNIDAVNGELKNKYGDKDIHISAGFYCPVSDEEDYTDYFKKADAALYEAKTTGRGKATIYK